MRKRDKKKTKQLNELSKQNELEYKYNINVDGIS